MASRQKVMSHHWRHKQEGGRLSVACPFFPAPVTDALSLRASAALSFWRAAAASGNGARKPKGKRRRDKSRRLKRLSALQNLAHHHRTQLGRASCRERVVQCGYISVVDV